LREAVPLPTVVLPEAFADEFGTREVHWISELLEAKWEARGHRGGVQQGGCES